MKSLFVIMPFGNKPVPHASKGAFDFDRLYGKLIRPTAERAGWKVLRIDEVPATGIIADQYLREIFHADLVLADISIPNGNVYYELGIRHASAAGGTILIALAGTVLPFDIASQRVIFYDDRPSAWKRAESMIVDVLSNYSASEQQNPVRRFLETIGATTSPSQDVAAFERDLRGRIDRVNNIDQLVAICMWVRSFSNVPVGPLLSLADRLADFQDWRRSAEMLRIALLRAPNDFEIHRKLGWCLQFAGPEFDNEASREFEEALRLNPNDPETLGMMGGRAKRLGDYAAAAKHYAEGARTSPNSLYMLVNEAALAILSDPNHQSHGIELYKKLLVKQDVGEDAAPDEWVEIVIAEAYFAIGDTVSAERHYEAAADIATSVKSLNSAARQLEVFSSVGFRTESARHLQEALKRLIGSLRRSASPVARSSESNQIATEDETTLPASPIFIHISDVHFGSVSKDGKTIPMHRFYEGENSQPLFRHLEDEFARRSSHFTFAPERLHLIVSGDLVYTGAEREYEEALQFLRDTSEALRLNPRNVHIIPGNHDISWNLAKQDKRYRFDPFLELLWNFYGEEIVKERYPLISWPVTVHNRPAAHDIVSISHDRASSLLIVGMNSCVFESEQHHYGFVGERQLKRIRELVALAAPELGAVRIAIMHHHLLPFPESLTDRPGESVWVDLSTIRDAGFVERSLERLGFDLVLHGHKHKPQLRETLVQDPDPSKGQLPRLIVAGAGTVSCTELESNVSNHYGVIEVKSIPRRAGAEFLRVEWRTLPTEAGAEWQTTKVWSIRLSNASCCAASFSGALDV